MKLNKRLALEHHAYAPELNKLHVKGLNKPLPAPGCLTLKAARALLFPRGLSGLFAIVSKVYAEPERAWLNRTHSGRVSSRLGALRLVNANFRQQKAPVLLLDGSTLNPPAVSIRFKFN